MKERSILYFTTTILLTVLTLISLIVSFLPWAPAYSGYIIPKFYFLLIPTIILWFGWFLEDTGFLLSASVVLIVFFFDHIKNIKILSTDEIFITPQYAPIVKTIYVVTFGVLLAAIITSYITSYFLKTKSK